MLWLCLVELVACASAQAMVFVGASACGFWISPAAAPGRIALTIITVLIMVYFIHATEELLPPIAYNVRIARSSLRSSAARVKLV